MKDFMQLIPESEVPTHLLSVEKNGEKRHFFLTKKQAQTVATNINSDDQFIALPNNGIFYPKFKSFCDLLTKQDLENFQVPQHEKDDIKRAQDELKRKEKKSKIDKWVDENKKLYGDIWNRILEKVKKNHPEIKELHLKVLVNAQVNVYISKNYI